MEQLRSELAELEGESASEVDSVLTDAEEAVAETAEASIQGTEEATETLIQASEEVAESIEQESESAAEELGHPELADRIADRLFQRMDERGLLPTNSSSPIPEAEHVAEEPAKEVESAPAQAETTVEEDTPPEPQHWFYKKRVRR